MRERELKLPQPRLPRRLRGSLPMRERELKQEEPKRLLVLHLVAPHAGA